MKNLKLRWRAFQQFAAYKQAIHTGLTHDEAILKSERLHPSSPDDIAFKKRLRMKDQRKDNFPYSFYAIFYPLSSSNKRNIFHFS